MRSFGEPDNTKFQLKYNGEYYDTEAEVKEKVIGDEDIYSEDCHDVVHDMDHPEEMWAHDQNLGRDCEFGTKAFKCEAMDGQKLGDFFANLPGWEIDATQDPCIRNWLEEAKAKLEERYEANKGSYLGYLLAQLEEPNTFGPDGLALNKWIPQNMLNKAADVVEIACKTPLNASMQSKCIIWKKELNNYLGKKRFPEFKTPISRFPTQT